MMPSLCVWRCGCRSTGETAFSVDELPSSALHPLHLRCTSCSLRAVVCECCQTLLDLEKEVDGVLLCKRCGFLTVLDASLRRRVQLAPFSRQILTHITPSFREIEELKQQWIEWESRARLSNATESSDRHISEPLAPRGAVPASIESPHSERAGSPSTSRASELRAEGKRLRHDLQGARRRWQEFLVDARQSAMMEQQQQHHQLSFSTTHLHILRSMYEKAMEKDELSELIAAIEQFLLHQSTILSAKYDLLAALKLWHHVDDLKTISSSIPPEPVDQATNVLVHCAKEQVRHWQRDFARLARPYLRLVATANKQLFVLYNAAQSLARKHDPQVLARAPCESTSSASFTSTRKRWLLGRSPNSGGHRSVGVIATTPSGGDISTVQHSIEVRHRVTEISKKVELWRALSFTIATTCVLGLGDLADVHAPHQKY
ncbi:hypothetical protein PINS_up009453 [Pythium insidiosum]|nr:hypothetical protein PINS_up009453 [Pythium insidiosum]